MRGLVVLWLLRLFLIVWVALDRDGIGFAEPASQVNLPAAVAAERQGRALGRIERAVADGATNKGHAVKLAVSAAARK